MNLLECVSVALISVRSNKMRSGLTMLGVIIGVAAVVIMVAIGEGANLQVSSQIQRLGSNLLVVTPGRMREPGVRTMGAFGSMDVLTLDDVEAIRDECPSVLAVAPEISSRVQVKHGTGSMQTQLVATTPEYLSVRAFNVSAGAFFTNADVQSALKVAVLGQGIVDELSPDQSLIGKEIKIGETRLTVIGIMETKGQSGMMNIDDTVYVPITTAQKRILGTKYVRTIYAQARNAKSMSSANDEIVSVLTTRLGKVEAFSVSNQADVLEAAQDVTRVFTVLLAGIAGVSLLVGGIGVMNIMLVSVTERTREIGLRKSVGARITDILLQFLIESVVLSVVGGAIGIIAGIAGSKIATRVAGWPSAISPVSVLIPFAFAVAVGLFFGIYPASRAARLNPVEALRYE
jgi:putative ABC transport system permease protein